MKVLKSIFGVLLLGVGMLACGQTAPESLPTAIPTVFLPPPTMVVAEIEPPPMDTMSPPPTFTPAEIATPVFVAPTPEPAAAAINITSPSDSSYLLTGSVVNVSGRGRVADGQRLVIQLVAINGYLLTQTTAPVESNLWQVDMTVPITITGAAQIQAQVQDVAGNVLQQDAVGVTLGANAAANPRYLELYRPVMHSKGVGGYYLFFDGYAGQPTGTIFIALYVDNCQTEAAATSFRVSSSSYWQGYLYIPNNLSGPGCAIARFGAPGADNWREAQIPIQLQKPDEEGAYAVYLFGPPHQTDLTGGSTVTFWGMAYNAADSQVIVTLLREDGVNLAQSSGTVNTFGYWEASLNIPTTYTGPAQAVITIAGPRPNDLAQAAITVTILPAPPEIEE
ncbi:MAG: hypothetical protein KJ063_16035 [Anaerolineae bacterium]|nr:hypothetical protein [Anaerolineae bacterium]